ncbi:HlyD family efflux transporter periplasmic adaptor subunit, partial [Patescibacteria group bacterium]|nr:HlyD family efflux transporter periplasmic adaptor subunit [Patescibacteria group bacterium]
RVLRSKWFYLICLLILVGGFYYFKQVSSTGTETRYVLAAVSTSTVINIISGTGQVSASNQININPAASGDILELNIISGQKVQTGDIIARLDDSDAQAQVRKAKNSLDAARASLNVKLAGPSTEEIAVSQKSVDSAKLSYENAEKNLEYTKISLVDNLSKSQLQVDNAQLSLDKAQRDYDDSLSSSDISASSEDQSFSKAYSDAQTAVSSAIITLRNILVTADNILEKNNYNSSSHTYKIYLGVRNSQTLNEADNNYEAARGSYIQLVSDYNLASLTWTNANIEDMLTKTEATANIMQALASSLSNVLINSITSSSFSQSALDAYKQSASSQESSSISLLSSLQTTARAIASAKLNSSASDISLSSSVDKAASALESAKNSLISAQNSLKQVEVDNQKSLDSANNDLASRKNAYESAEAQFDLKIAKPRTVDLTSYYLQIASAEVSYQEALDVLAETSVKAPIDGIIAQVNKKAGDSVRNTEAGDTLATIITEDKVATMSLNEVDAAKVKVGQKATLTFSALEDLSITGTVVEIDSVGTVTQGVVTYDVKITLDVQDERIKPQMTVSADIIVEQSVNVLTVPNAALKTDSNGDTYVETLEFTGTLDSAGILSDTDPEAVYVSIGLADDNNTAIISGLEEG